MQIAQLNSSNSQNTGAEWAAAVFPKLEELDAAFGDGTAEDIKSHLIATLKRRAYRIGAEKLSALYEFSDGFPRSSTGKPVDRMIS